MGTKHLMRNQLVKLSVVIAFVVAVVGATPHVYAANPSIALSPTTTSVDVGQQFTMQVVFNTQGQSVVSVIADITFDASTLEAGAANIDTQGSPFGINPPPIIDPNDAGHINLTGAMSGGAGGFTGQGVLATIHFTPKQPANTTPAAVTLTTNSAMVPVTAGQPVIIPDLTSATVTIGAHGIPTPPTNGDTTPPTIGTPQVSSVNDNSVTVAWTTDESTTGTVNYGTSTSLGLTGQSNTAATAHSVTLTNLVAGTKYFYTITAKDASNNVTTTQVANFTTSGTAPIGGGGGGGGTTTPPPTTGTQNTSTTTGTTNNSAQNLSKPKVAPQTGTGMIVTIVIVIGLGFATGATYFYLTRRHHGDQNL